MAMISFIGFLIAEVNWRLGDTHVTKKTYLRNELIASDTSLKLMVQEPNSKGTVYVAAH